MMHPEGNAKGYSIFEDTMADMTYLQIEEAAREKNLVLLPVGLMEEHGPHLPLAVDVYGAYINTRRVKVELEKSGIKSLIAPPFYWGMNNATASFAGSFTVREETMVNLLWDMMASLKRWGFERAFIINHHYDEDHTRALKTAIQKARLDTGLRVYWIIGDFLAKKFRFTGREPYLLIYEAPPAPSSEQMEIHADSYETGFMMHYFTGLVDLEILKSLKPTGLTLQDLMVWRQGWDDARKVTPLGFFGDPASATPGQGRDSVEGFGKAAAEVIERFLQGKYRPPELK